MMLRRKSNTKRRGLSLVETAIVSSVFFMFIFGILEYGRYVMVRNVLENAAREGARYAVVHTYDKNTTDVRNVVMSYLAGQGYQLDGFDPNTNIQIYKVDAAGNPVMDGNGQPVSWNEAAYGEGIGVFITGNYRPVLPVFLFMGDTIPLNIRCSMSSEAN
jgi:Flp pilus assembly protein TadG